MKSDATVCPHCTRAVTLEDLERFEQQQGGFGVALLGAGVIVVALLILGALVNWLWP